MRTIHYSIILTTLFLRFLHTLSASPEAILLFNSQTFLCNTTSTTNQPYTTTLESAGMTTIDGATQLSVSFWIQTFTFNSLGLNEYSNWVRFGLNNNEGTTDYAKLSIYYEPLNYVMFYQFNDTKQYYQSQKYQTSTWYYIYAGVDYGAGQGYAVLYTPILSSEAPTYYLIESATSATSDSPFTAATILQLGDIETNNFCGTMNYFKVIANYYTTTEFSYYLMNDDPLTLMQWIPFSENDGRQGLDISGNGLYAVFESTIGPYWSLTDYKMPGLVFNATNQFILMPTAASFYASSATTTIGVTIRYFLQLTSIPTCNATIFVKNLFDTELTVSVSILANEGNLTFTFGSVTYTSAYTLASGKLYDMAHYLNNYMGKQGVDMYTFVDNQLAFNKTFYNLHDYIESGSDTVQIGSDSCSFEGFFRNWIVFTGFPALIVSANSTSCLFINTKGSCCWTKTYTAISNCTTGTYADTQIGFCIPCDIRCASCSSAYGNNCPCANPFTNINGACVCPTTGYFYDSDGATCIECNETCLTCTNETYLNCTSCSTGSYFLVDQCLSDCPGGVYGKIYWPDVHNQSCEPLNSSQINNLDKIILGRSITSYIFYAVIFPLVALKRGSQLWFLWDSCQLLYLYSFLNVEYQQQELFWVLDSFNFSMLELAPNVPYNLLNSSIPPINGTKVIPTMSMFVLKQTSIYFLYNAGAAFFVTLIWIALCYLILVPMEFLFSLCKATKVVAVFKWFNANWRLNVLLRLFLQFSPVFFFYACFQMFFTQFSDAFFLANYIIAFFTLVITWLAIMICAYYLRIGFVAIKDIQESTEKKIKDKLEIQNEKTNYSKYPKISSTLIDGFILMKKRSKFYYMYIFLLKVLTCVLIIALYSDGSEIPQLLLNIILSTLMLVYEIFFFRMDNAVYYIFHLIVRSAFWLLSVLLFIMNFTANNPGILNLFGVILVIIILAAHALAIIYAIPMGIQRLRNDYKEWKEAQRLKENLQDDVAVELTVVTGAKRRRIRKPKDDSSSVTDVVTLNQNRDREGDQYASQIIDQTKEDDPSKAKRLKPVEKPQIDDDSYTNFAYDRTRIKRQKFEKSRVNEDESIHSASKIRDNSEMPSQHIAFDDISADRLNPPTDRPSNTIQDNANQSSLIAVQNLDR